ncbi:MAG: glycosyltransferase, partial [Solirubrobacteraceae bacterium]
RVIFADWVSEADLEGLWSLADVAAFPTLAEGFGLPVVEAMARGVRIAASDLPVLREIGADWPRYFEPHDPESVAQAVGQALAAPLDPARGRALVSAFTWENAARLTWSVYDHALGG